MGFELWAACLLDRHSYLLSLLAIMAPIGFGSYCTLKLLFSRVSVLPQV
jgi:hypothetical protein